MTLEDAKDWLYMMSPERAHAASLLYEYIKRLEQCTMPHDLKVCREMAEEYANTEDCTDDDGDAWDGGI